MSILQEAEWRFDQVQPEHEWAACVWEYGRRWHSTPGRCGRLFAKMATIGQLGNMDGFPAKPWLGLTLPAREKPAQRWRYAPGELEDYEPLVRNRPPGDIPFSVEDWKKWLRMEGVVVFDLGLPPRDVRPDWQSVFGAQRQPTRAELLARFGAWLDANPEWWEGHGDGRVVARIGGKESPRDGLRALSWAKLREAAGSDKAACAYLAEQFSGSSELKQWFAISLEPRAAPTRSLLKKNAEKWQKRICEPI